MTKIKLIPVLVVAALYWILGGIWYSPLLFANKFVALIGWTPQQIAALQQAGETQSLILALSAHWLCPSSSPTSYATPRPIMSLMASRPHSGCGWGSPSRPIWRRCFLRSEPWGFS